MVVYLANAFSLGMLASWKRWTLDITEIGLDEARTILCRGFVSTIGHQATADFLSKLLGFTVRAVRRQINLEDGDAVVVFQLLQRLPEGRVLTEEELRKVPYKIYLVEASWRWAP